MLEKNNFCEGKNILMLLREIIKNVERSLLTKIYEKFVLFQCDWMGSCWFAHGFVLTRDLAISLDRG